MSTVEQWAVRVARAESAYTTLNAVDESIDANLAATKPHEADARGRAAKRPNNDEAGTPMGSEKPKGPATQHGGSSGSGVQRNDSASSVVTRSADEELLEVT